MKINFKNEVYGYFNEILNAEKVSAFYTQLSNIKNEYEFSCIYTCFDKCKDNYVLTIDGENYINPIERYKNKKLVENLAIDKTNSKRIVILLESPHKDEFTKKFNAPALGKTGEKLDYYLSCLLKKFKYVNKGDKVFLVNAIQYQCSLGYPTSCVKKRVFNYLFEKDEVKKDLIERIKRIDPDIICISTTSFCREKVQKLIVESFTDKVIISSDSHPSMWTTKTKIKEEKNEEEDK